MASHTKVLNISKNCRIKRSQAINRIAGGTAAWVEEGFSMRDLSLAEILAIRQAQPIESHSSAYSRINNEIPGLRWEPPQSDKYAIRTRYPLMREALELLDAH